MNKIKKYIATTLMALAMVLPIIQPLAVHAEETGNQHISISGGYIRQLDELESQSYNFECDVKSGYLIVGVKSITSTGSDEAENIEMYVFQNGKYVGSLTNTNKYKTYCENGTLNWTYLVGDKEQNMIGTANLTGSGYALPIFYLSKWSATGVSCNLKWSGFKVFETAEQALSYAQSGTTDGEIEAPKTGLDKEWYLKNIGYSVRAEDGGENEDATFIKFTWDTDNLQDGDLIEIKTHNWYRTLTGSQYSGFHDYITFSNGVSAMNGSYEISQYEATNAWFKSLDNTPLVFKSFDTDTYYLRPYRNGVYGGWVKISMKRNPAIKGTPYVNNVEYGDFDEETGDFVIDSDRTQTEGGYGITQKGEPVVPDEYDGLNNVGTVITTAGDALKYFFSNITSIMGLFGQLPQLLNAVIGWLPSPLIVLICASVVVVIILRIFGR